MHDVQDAAVTGNEEAEQGSIELVLDVVESINYACWQNSIPFLRSLKIRNSTGLTLVPVKE